MQTNDTKANRETFLLISPGLFSKITSGIKAQTAPGEPAPVQRAAHSAICAALLSAMAAFISAASQAAVDLRELEFSFASWCFLFWCWQRGAKGLCSGVSNAHRLCTAVKSEEGVMALQFPFLLKSEYAVWHKCFLGAVQQSELLCCKQLYCENIVINWGNSVTCWWTSWAGL